MTRVSVNGIEFNAADGEPSDFEMFNEGSPKATDTAPHGMVEEMRMFIGLQDIKKLRRLLDVGALFGVFSLVFTRYADATAVAIEPGIEAFQGLAENCQLNPERQISPCSAFCGEKEGNYVTCGVEWKHMVANRGQGTQINAGSIPSGGLTQLFPKETFDCIKIDVEGFESPVLRGARELIERCKPVIFLEVHFSVLPQVSNDTNESIFALIKALKYTPYEFNGERVETFAGVNWHRYLLLPDKI